MSFSLTIRSAEDLAVEARLAALASITAAIDAHVEAQARSRGYNSAAHLAGYAGSTVPDWAAEARAFVAWRDAVWLAAYAVQAGLADAGTPPQPEAVLAALPVWRD